MAWSTPMTAIAGATFTAAQFNMYVRDNLNQTAPAITTQVSSFVTASAAGALVERIPTQAFASGSSTTTSTSYGNLADAVTTSVTVNTGSRALVSVYCNFFNSAANRTWMGFSVSGATTVSSTDTKALNQGTSQGMRWGASWVQTALNPGSNTFTLQYRVTAGTGTFSVRRIAVVPF